MRTEQDLRDTLLAHADLTPSLDFPARVRHQIKVVRRRRQATIASLGLACLTVAGVVALPRIAPSEHHVASPKKITLPKYDQGGKLAGSADFLTDETREATFAITPDSWDLYWVTRCAPESLGGQANIAVLINGDLATAGSCGSGASFSGATGHAETALTQRGVKLGEPIAITVRIVGPDWGKGKPDISRYEGPMPNVRVVAGMYVGVPVDEYPFPHRPKKLKPLEDPHGDVLVYLGNRAGSINGETLTRFPYSDDLSIDAFAVEPGTLTLLVNGVELTRFNSWDYDGSGYGIRLDKDVLSQHGLHLEPGQELTLMVVAERFNDFKSWQVVVTRQ